MSNMILGLAGFVTTVCNRQYDSVLIELVDFCLNYK